MSTKDRRLRERAEREQRFLDKAQELIQRDGLMSLQMGRIAEECDYAIGTLYQHFASKGLWCIHAAVARWTVKCMNYGGFHRE